MKYFHAILVMASALGLLAAPAPVRADDAPVIVVKLLTGPEPAATDAIMPTAGVGVPNGSVSVKPVSGGDGEHAKTDSYGGSQVEVDTIETVYKVTVEANGRTGVEYVRAAGPFDKARQVVTFDLRQLPDTAYADDPNAAATLTEAIRAAANNCDRAEYDRLVHQLQLLNNMDRINEASLQDQAKSERFSVKTSAGKALEEVRKRRKATDAALSHLPAFPSACSLKTADQTDCPKGGGLLAGTINNLFGSNIQPVCQDGPIRGHNNGISGGGSKHHDD
jgi:hypothetical protein